MAVKVTSKENQAKGVFAGGAIVENKPIGFPQDGGTQRPYSNLFYWANASTDVGGLIDEHPHKMFEILSFVLEGEIEHYDSKFNRWLKLSAGDAQIIRSRGGITHAERLLKNSRIFQIWFDPNIRTSMLEEASYDDYKSVDMEYAEEGSISYKYYTGLKGPIDMDAEGVEIQEMTLSSNEHQIKLNPEKVYSYYVVQGNGEMANQPLKENDFVIVENEEELIIKNDDRLKLFLIVVPQQLSYKTYSELVNF